MQRRTRIGSLCTGYGGLDMAATAVFNGTLAWCADNDRHASTVLGVHYPGVPNLGDITALNWRDIPPVDILCAGFPCQDISYAGTRAGIKRGTRSGLWITIMEGIRLLAPKIIVVENVAAIRHRGLDQVLGDLAESGYDAVWTSIRASNVGAPHRRERTFILAYQPSARAILTAADAAGQRRARRTAAGCAASRRPPGRPERSRPRTVPGSAPAPDSAGLCRDETARERSRRSPASVTSGWGVYESAVRRWERIIGRTAPYPVETGTKGQPRLSPALSEWLMGLPAGFVTDLGLPYSAQHRLLGNGVVPQQASAALRQLVRSAAREVPSA